MRNVLIVLCMLLCSVTSAVAQVSVGIGLPGVSIGINLPVYPELVPVPGYPVYYAPQVNSNYFFYDGMYWVYQGDNWYASSWYNGPWGLVAPEAVPLFVLRVPVRYYRRPPVYFRGWRSDAPPRWGEHWGNAWAQRRSGWDNWNRRAVPAPAPLPAYQRQYSGARYPRVEQQQVLQSQNYRYQPRDAVVQQRYQAQRAQSAPTSSPQVTQRVQSAPASSPQVTQRAQSAPMSSPQATQRAQSAPISAPQATQRVPQERRSPPQDQRSTSRPSSLQQGALPAPRGQAPQTGSVDVQRRAAVPAPPQQGRPTAQHQMQQPQQGAAPHQAQQPQQGVAQRDRQAPKQGQEKPEQQGGERNK